MNKIALWIHVCADDWTAERAITASDVHVTYPVSSHAGQTSIHVLVYEIVSPTELAFVRTVNKTYSAVAIKTGETRLQVFDKPYGNKSECENITLTKISRSE